MPVSIDLADADVWDDSALVKSWNTALKEYKKYHSIHAKGQKLSDVLTKEELDMLAKNGLDMHKESSEDQNGSQKHEQESDGDAPMLESEEEVIEAETGYSSASQQQQSAQQLTMDASNHVPQAPPQVLMNSVKDESIRNLMMSWYWAGYYTGLHEGQQLPSTKP